MSDGIDYDRLYTFRHRGVDQATRQRVWEPIARRIHAFMGAPERVLDPAAGRGEFINAVPAAERWCVEAVDFGAATYDPDVKAIIGNAMDVDLPQRYFDGVFASNLLEHFTSQDDIARFLGRMCEAITPGGTIAVMGPNFRYCAREYFDCADHTLALTHVSVEEHLYAAGLEPTRVIPRFLPYSFRGLLPPSPALTGLYLRFPIAWRLLGKQFLVLARVAR